MATCKEENDERDEPCVDSDISPMSIRMSDECALDDGNDSDGSDTDSSTNSATEFLQGVHVVIHHKCKMNRSLVDFKARKYISLTLEHYLKWQYVVKNDILRQQKIQELRKMAENASFTDGILQVFLGRQRSDPDFDKVNESIKAIFLSDTDSICISWFPLKASCNSKDVYQMLTGIIQQSDIIRNQELYTDMANNRIIRFVFDIKNMEKVDEIATKTVQDYEKKQLYGYHSIKINLPVVYHHIFDRLNVKMEARKSFPVVRVLCDVIESKDEFTIELRGPIKEVHDLKKWLEDIIIIPYCCVELDFDEIGNFDKPMDIPSVIEETLKYNQSVGLYWSMNEYSRKLWLCSLNKQDSYSAVEAIKTCIIQSTKHIQPLHLETTEQMITELVDAGENVIGKSLSLTIMAGYKELIIYSIGCRNRLKTVDTWFEKYMQTSTAYATDTPSTDVMVLGGTVGLGDVTGDYTSEMVLLTRINHAKRTSPTLYIPILVSAGESEHKMTVAREDQTWSPKIHHTTIDAFPMPRNHMEEGKGPGAKIDTRSMPGKPDVSEEDKPLVPDAYKHLEPNADTPVMPGDDGSSERDSKIQRDARRIISTGSTKDIWFKELPHQSMVQFGVDEIKDPNDIKHLQTMGIPIKGNGTKSSILTPTKYQLEYALYHHDIGCGSKQRVDREGFNAIEYCTNDVWDLVETMKAKELKDLKQRGLQVAYEGEFLVISNLKCQADDSCFNVLKSYIRDLKDKEIIEVTMREENTDLIKTWCREVESEQNMQCCVFVEKRNITLAFGDTYDIVQRVKHHLLVRDGQVEITGRRRRGFKNTDEEVTEIIQHVIDEPKKAQSDSRTHHPVENRGRRPEGKRSRATEKNPEFDLKRQAKNIEAYNTDENMAVYVYEANILKLPVDCIVNAANKSLQHDGGVARVIAQAAGRRLDQEGFDYISKNGEVPVGQMCVTTAGKLHYDCVIHAVGPCWSDYYPHSLQDVHQCENHLYSALMESFRAAEERGLESIALPAISAVIFAVPEEVCVYHYAKATLDYSRKKSPNALKEIHFIDINPRIVSSIQKMFTSMLTHGNYPYYSTEKFVKTKKTNKPSEPKSSEKHDFGNKASSDRFAPVYYKSGESHVFESERCTLFIQSGDLMKIKAAAIVSLEDMGGSGKGRISKLITETISSMNRSHFNRDKKEFFRKYPKPGDVHVTWGYDSGYQYVLHAVLPYDIRNESPEKRKSVIEQAEQNILRELNERSIDSVAMHLMGAGSESRDEVRIAAHAFIHVYIKHCKEKGTQRSKPLHITLVCRDNTVLSNVIEKFGEYGLLGDTKPPPPVVPPRLARSQDLKKPEGPGSLEDCVICMEKITDRKVLKCGHAFDKDCIDQAFNVNKVCPICGTLCDELTGDQPEGRRSKKTDARNHCAGFDNCGRIAITYTFPSGRQGPDHPNPGKPYFGISRTGYLPDTTEGREVLEMLEIAFDRKLTFTIGTSRITGEEGVITWNDIHHKTDPKPYTQFGYPDPTYLDRVKDELSAKGITVEDIKKKKKVNKPMFFKAFIR